MCFPFIYQGTLTGRAGNPYRAGREQGKEKTVGNAARPIPLHFDQCNFSERPVDACPGSEADRVPYGSSCHPLSWRRDFLFIHYGIHNSHPLNPPPLAPKEGLEGVESAKVCFFLSVIANEVWQFAFICEKHPYPTNPPPYPTPSSRKQSHR